MQSQKPKANIKVAMAIFYLLSMPKYIHESSVMEHPDQKEEIQTYQSTWKMFPHLYKEFMLRGFQVFVKLGSCEPVGIKLHPSSYLLQKD